MSPYQVRPAWLASVFPYCEKTDVFLMLPSPHLAKKGLEVKSKSRSVSSSNKDDEKDMTKSGRCTSYDDGQKSFFFFHCRAFPVASSLLMTMLVIHTPVHILSLAAWEAAIHATSPSRPSVSLQSRFHSLPRIITLLTGHTRIFSKDFSC